MEQILLIIALFAIVFIGVLAFLLIEKNEQVQKLTASVNKLQQSFQELDEQAKLIVKTDLELNKAQEELDKRLNGLEALQKISRLINTTLDEKEIFNRLSQFPIMELGFEKILILIFNNQKELQCRVAQGIPSQEIEKILIDIQQTDIFTESLNKGQTISSLNASKAHREIITNIVGTDHFILSPILSQSSSAGLIFVGNSSNALALTAGDEELISILADQIGQAIENSQLFEQVYRSTQILEKKVQDRTKELASALEEVQKISKTKSDFVSAVSHELRTPLTSIKGYASLLMTGKLGNIPDSVKERLGKINIHSDNLVKLINDLLDISRLESGRVEMKFEQCSLKTIIENIHDLLIPQMKDKNIQWLTHIPDTLPAVSLDKAQIERVFINLMGNAIKFSPPHGTITISVNPYSEDKEKILIKISDTGIGITAEDLKKLFQEFFRVDNAINQNTKGTGLGLALVKRIVEAHKGQIWATSQLNQGTTFHFTLPMAKEADSKKYA